jgi:hypothetical protein
MPNPARTTRRLENPGAQLMPMRGPMLRQAIGF